MTTLQQLLIRTGHAKPPATPPANGQSAPPAPSASAAPPALQDAAAAPPPAAPPAAAPPAAAKAPPPAAPPPQMPAPQQAAPAVAPREPAVAPAASAAPAATPPQPPPAAPAARVTPPPAPVEAKTPPAPAPKAPPRAPAARPPAAVAARAVVAAEPEPAIAVGGGAAAMTLDGGPMALGLKLPLEPDWRAVARLGMFIALAFFAGFGAWAALAPLSSATIAPGQVKAEGDRRTVQHLEGGIVREFLVRDGDRVTAGQPLVRLDDTQAGASADLLTSQLDMLRASDARLTAEAAGSARLVFPPDLMARRQEPRVAEVLASQEAVFANRSAALANQIGVLSQRIEQSQAEIRSYQAQANSADRQLALTRDELNGVEQLLQRGYERRPRLLALQRQAAELQGNRDQQRELIVRAERAIAEAQAQIAALRSDRQREIATDQNETQSRIAETQERLRAASDVRRRLDVVAPIDGVVANMRFFTVGAVVRPGEPILEIVPMNEALVVEAQVSPTDIENVSAGLRAEVRFLGLRRRVVPVLLGDVTYVAADVSVNERSGNAFYKATVRIPPDQMRLLDGTILQPGMPTEVYIIAGERTMLGYIFQPVRDSFRRAFRER